MQLKKNNNVTHIPGGGGGRRGVKQCAIKIERSVFIYATQRDVQQTPGQSAFTIVHTLCGRKRDYLNVVQVFLFIFYSDTNFYTQKQ